MMGDNNSSQFKKGTEHYNVGMWPSWGKLSFNYECQMLTTMRGRRGWQLVSYHGILSHFIKQPSLPNNVLSKQNIVTVWNNENIL